jgi:hydroxymethylpyrimidine pyrophosphatase-like HAD family hydrolase
MVPPIKHYEGEKVAQLLCYAEDELRDKLLDLSVEEENAVLKRAVEISPAGCSKGQAMLRVAREFGYIRQDIVAFGDSGNDIDMMERAGLGIAMGNGSKECREAADYVTEDISDDGLYKALVRFGFIEG